MEQINTSRCGVMWDPWEPTRIVQQAIDADLEKTTIDALKKIEEEAKSNYYGLYLSLFTGSLALLGLSSGGIGLVAGQVFGCFSVFVAGHNLTMLHGTASEIESKLNKIFDKEMTKI